MNHLSNSRYSLDHFGTSSPASETERPRPLAGGPPRNDETQSRAGGKALQRLLLRPVYQLYEIRLEFGGLKIEQVQRLKDLELENNRLRKAVSDLTLDKLILQEAARGNF